ncbi:hypothetical protein CVT25_001238 [Psilocybe cyanescens]|uniref:Nephrocystin 3-like N-terminal domain-containing protein n=1 Tax=Psilocybe cyanescens TaxID=93625 RepID=A0A409XAU6_PSICY|nr:hypothetical protein CVT25_001238 [Psilocybe cyanescens]
MAFLEAKHDESRAMFDVKALTLITGGIFNFTTGGDDRDDHRHKVHKAFERYVAQNATNDSIEVMDAPRCHPKTRRTILKKLADWVEQSSHRSSEPVLWLYGPAGAGKTAIGHSLAELLSIHGRLGATFFFLRTADNRNNARLLVSTMAYNRTCSSRATQMEQLIVNPVLSSLSSAGDENPLPRALIIDGLDECSDRNVQSRILTIIGSVAPRLSGKIKFLIFSRSEFHIETTFKSPKMKEITRIINLKDDLSTLDDILAFLEDRFEDIKRTHPLQHMIEPSWPLSEDIEKLIHRSCRNFIYPQVIMKYIEAEYERPQKRLQIILDLSPTSDTPYGEMDAIYRHVLTSTRVQRALLLQILGVISNFRGDPQNIALACTTQFQERILFLDPGEISLKLLDLRSIITFESYIAAHPHLYFPNVLHASLFDFLLDPQRSQELWIDADETRSNITVGILTFVKQSIQKLADKSRTRNCDCRSQLLCDHKWHIFYNAMLFVSAPPTFEMQHAVMNYDIELVYDLILAEEDVERLLGAQAIPLQLLSVLESWKEYNVTNLFEYHQAKYNDFLRRALNKYHSPQSVLATALALFSSLGTQTMRSAYLAELVRPCVSYLYLYHHLNSLSPARRKFFSEEISKKDKLARFSDFQTIVQAISPLASGELKMALLFTERIIAEGNEYISAQFLAGFLVDQKMSGQYHCGDRAWYDATVYCLNFLRSDGPSQDVNCVGYFLEAIARLLVLQLYYESSKILSAGQVASDVIYLPKKIEFPFDYSFLVDALSHCMTLASSYYQPFSKFSSDAAKFCDIAQAFLTVCLPSPCPMSHTNLTTSWIKVSSMERSFEENPAAPCLVIPSSTFTCNPKYLRIVSLADIRQRLGHGPV